MKTEVTIMRCVLVGCFFYLHGILGDQSLPEIKPNKDNPSSLIKPNVFQDMLNRESQVRLLMVTKIQELMTGAADSKKVNQALMRNLSDITAQLEVIAEKDRLMEEENAQLRLELNTLNETINHREQIPEEISLNLDMTTTPFLIAKWEADYSNFKHHLTAMSEADHRIDEARNRLDNEIKALRLNRNLTMGSLDRLAETGLSLVRKQLAGLQKANDKLSFENTEMKQQLAILNNTLQNVVNKHQLDALNIDYNQRFQVFDATLKNFSLSINETLGNCLSEQRNKCDEKQENILTTQSPDIKESCMEILKDDPKTQGKDGVYKIRVGSVVRSVYCDMSTKGGGWTVIQRRQDGSTNFTRDWEEYKQGFGDPSTNYWIGNDAIHELTKTSQRLRVQILDIYGRKAYAEYSSFSVGNEANKYTLHVSGYSGTAGEAMIYHRGSKFSTYDQDNDGAKFRSCAKIRRGGWWYNSCVDADLNTVYWPVKRETGPYILWAPWKYQEALKGTLMMIRPKT